MSTNVFYRLVIPDWVLDLGLTQNLRDIKTSFDELQVRCARGCG